MEYIITFVLILAICGYAGYVIYKRIKDFRRGKYCSCGCDGCSGCDNVKKKKGAD